MYPRPEIAGCPESGGSGCRWPLISGKLAGVNWAERDAAVVWHGFTQMGCYTDNAPVIVESAEGRELIDIDGRRYLDAISSLWVTTLGHGVPELDEAMTSQLARVAHSTMLGNGNRVVIEFAEALAAVVPVDRPHFLFASDGASAVEQALRIAFQYWANRGVAGRTRYLAMGGAYHGDTVGALSVGDDNFHSHMFDELRFPVLRGPSLRDPDWAGTTMRMLSDHAHELAALVIEPLVQGAAGMQVGSPEAFRDVGRRCQEAGVLLICDEVATGFGRTGTLFASDACGLRPDLMCLGKGLTGGYLPMSATAATEHVYQEFIGPDLGDRTLHHGHSYGGNALAAAVGLRHLQLLRETDVLAGAGARSAQLRERLAMVIAPLRAVGEVRLQGLMCGVELVAAPGETLARRVCTAAVARGVLLRSLGDVVTIVPPLTITADEIERIVQVLHDAIIEVVGS